jgi:hypothetical protein
MSEWTKVRGYEEILEDAQVAVDNGVGETWYADNHLPLIAERDALAAQLAQVPECYRRPAVSSRPTIQTDDGDIGGTC